jgi:DNA-binding transcriptional LysR family regulator
MAPPEANQISLDLLRTLVTFSEVGQVEETARHLKLTQAAISLQLKKLEQELRVPLFKAVGRKKVLTPQARELVAHLLPLIDSMENAVKSACSKNTRRADARLRVGCRPELLKKVVSLIRHQGPLQFFSMTREESLRALKDDKIDIGIVTYPPDSPHFISRRIFEDEIKLVVHKDLLKAAGIPIKHDFKKLALFLAKWPFVAYGLEAPFIRELADYFDQDPKKFNLNYICEEWCAVLELVSSYKAWSLVPSHQIQSNPNLIIYDLPVAAVKPYQYYSVSAGPLKSRTAFFHLKSGNNL